MTAAAPALLTRPELARYLRRSVSTVKRLERQGLPRYDVAGALYSPDEVIAWLKRSHRHGQRRSHGRRGAGFIYFAEIEGVDLIKLGWSRQPEQRIRGIRTDTGLPVVLRKTWPASMAEEKALLRLFGAHRIADSEWFRRDPVVLALLDDDVDVRRLIGLGDT